MQRPAISKLVVEAAWYPALAAQERGVKQRQKHTAPGRGLVSKARTWHPPPRRCASGEPGTCAAAAADPTHPVHVHDGGVAALPQAFLCHNMHLDRAQAQTIAHATNGRTWADQHPESAAADRPERARSQRRLSVICIQQCLLTCTGARRELHGVDTSAHGLSRRWPIAAAVHECT